QARTDQHSVVGHRCDPAQNGRPRGLTPPQTTRHSYRDLRYLLPRIPLFFIVESGNFYRFLRYVLSFQPVTTRLMMLLSLLLQVGGSTHVGRPMRLGAGLLALGFLLLFLLGLLI